MAKAKNTNIFVCKLIDCVKEYKKQLNDTRDEKDAAYFFDAKLKTFIKQNIEEITLLSTLNFERPFISWVKLYLLKD
jgi:hypothetical protein